MPTTESLAAVVTDKRQIEMRSFPVPQVSPADAILKVELCGICGSDYHYYIEGEHWPYQLPPQKHRKRLPTVCINADLVESSFIGARK